MISGKVPMSECGDRDYGEGPASMGNEKARLFELYGGLVDEE